MATATAAQRTASTGTAAASDYWEQKSVAYDCLHDRLWVMLREVTRHQPGSLLDVGCATGEVARAVLASCPSIDYYGCDISHAAVAKLGRANVVQCDLNHTGVPFANRRFDCVVASGICEYVRDQGAFLKQLAERLGPGGHLVVSYINTGHVARRWRRFRGKRPRDNATWQPLASLPQFEGLLANAGLTVQRCIPTNGRLSKTTDITARLSILRATCQFAPALLPLLAPQAVYVARRET